MFTKNKSAPKSAYLKTSYEESMVIKAFDTPWRKKWTVVGAMILIAVPFFFSNYAIHLANLVAISSIGALGLNLLCGNAGLFSLGQSGFIAAGAFTAGILTHHFDMPIWVVLPISIMLGGLLGFIAGLPSLKIKGIYLGLSTLAMNYIIVYILSEYQYYGNFYSGIKIKNPQIGFFSISSDIRWYFFLLVMVLVTAIFITNLLRTRVGRAWIAIKNRDIAAEIIGIPIGRYKVLAFAVSTGIVSMSGCLHAYYSAGADVEEYTFMLTISYLAMIIIGGMGSVLGSLMGSFMITLLPYILMYFFDLFNVTGVLKEFFFAVQAGLFGLIMMLFLLLEPLGLAEIWRRIRDYFMMWPFKYRTLTATTRRKR